jgi:hypothetical protein
LFFEYIDKIADQPEFLTHEVWVMGDCNLDLKKRNKNTKSLYSLLKTHGLKSHINLTTHPTKNGGSCIDLVISNTLNLIKSGTLATMISDHYPVYAIRGRKNKKPSYKHILARSYKNLDLEHLSTYISDFDWNKIDSRGDINEIWEHYIGVLVEYLNNICPLRPIKIRLHSKPWINQDILDLISKRNKIIYENKHLQAGQHFTNIVNLRKEIHFKVKQAKSNFYRKSLLENWDKPKKYWRIINSLLKPNCQTSIRYDFIDTEN